ncbi:MAG: hypothetical protein ACRCYS_17870, partial [Beijerinckiaceae bacterium]
HLHDAKFTRTAAGARVVVAFHLHHRISTFRRQITGLGLARGDGAVGLNGRRAGGIGLGCRD